jgi:hypothetical protein
VKITDKLQEQLNEELQKINNEAQKKEIVLGNFMSYLRLSEEYKDVTMDDLVDRLLEETIGGKYESVGELITDLQEKDRVEQEKVDNMKKTHEKLYQIFAVRDALKNQFDMSVSTFDDIAKSMLEDTKKEFGL